MTHLGPQYFFIVSNTYYRLKDGELNVSFQLQPDSYYEIIPYLFSSPVSLMQVYQLEIFSQLSDKPGGS